MALSDREITEICVCNPLGQNHTKMQFEFKDYQAPTWKLTGDDSRDWQELRHQAMHAILTGENGGLEQVNRNAEVSINNKHHCTSCYCCACWSVLSDIRQQADGHTHGPSQE